VQLKRILVAIGGSSVDPDVIRLSLTLARPAKAEIVAVHVIEVRWNLPLDAVLDPELDHGEQVLGAAAKIAEKGGQRIETELLQARDAAAAIIDTARERRADLVLLGMPYRTRLGRVYVGKTVQNVYVGSPCAVLAYREEAPQ